MLDLLTRLHGAVVLMFDEAVGAFAAANVALASGVLERDREPDALYDDLFHAAIVRLQAGQADAAMDVHALFAGKSLERIGDHATNIAEEVRFLARGEIPSATRPG
jgi:phosphate transport system protein